MRIAKNNQAEFLGA